MGVIVLLTSCGNKTSVENWVRLLVATAVDWATFSVGTGTGTGTGTAVRWGNANAGWAVLTGTSNIYWARGKVCWTTYISSPTAAIVHLLSTSSAPSNPYE
jgi:hypothetical protein